jgi:hypothetical protein
MKLFTFKLDHPQAENYGSGVIASLPARSRKEAEAILAKEFMFHENSPINGYLFDITFVRAAELPAASAFAVEEKVIRVQTPDGGVWEKAFK